MPATLTQDEAHALLDSQPGWLTLTTISADGYPHSIPAAYVRIGDDIFVGGSGGKQRLKNIQRNPKVSAMVEVGTTPPDLQGVLIQGNAEIIDAPEDVLPLMREASELRGTPENELPTEARPGVVYIRIRPTRLISWDYSRNT